MTDYNASSYLLGLGPMLQNQYGTTVDTIGAAPAAGYNARAWAIAGGVFADLTSATATFEQVRLQQTAQRAQASASSFRARMLELDRRAAEKQAQSILRAGQAEIGRVTLEGGQRRAALEARMAASGVDASGANAIEAQVSERLMQEIDAYNINLESVQQANAVRRRAVDLGNQAGFQRQAAVSLRRQARVAAPESAFLGGAASSAARTGYLLAYKPS